MTSSPPAQTGFAGPPDTLSLHAVAPPLTVQAPRLHLVGGGTIAQTAAVLARLGITRPLIVTDAFVARSGLLERLTQVLDGAGMRWRVFDGTIPDPTTEVVAQGLACLREAPADAAHDGLIGFGGGSPMDTAKAIAILAAAGGGRLADWKVPAAADLPGALPVVCIPTTAGTGSEVTRFTVVTDTATDEKMLIMGLAALPVAAIVDYELTLAKPLRLTADTGIDTLTHAIEAYVSRRANLVSDLYACQAMQLVAGHLETACREPGNTAARAGMALAATLAGLAFSNASVALVHGMSRPIGAHFHVPHGLSNAMLLPAVTRFSLPGAMARYATCARIMGWCPPDTGHDAAAACLIAGLVEQNRRLEVPSPAAWGIEEARFQQLMPLMAEQALASGSPANNPVVPDAGQIIALYQQVWSGGSTPAVLPAA